MGEVAEQGSLTDNLQSVSSKIERKVEDNTLLNAQLIKQGIADASIPIGVVLASIATGGTSALPTLCYSFCVATGAGVVIELLVPKNAVSLKELLKLIATFATMGLTPSKNTISEFCNATVLHFVGRSYRYVVNKMCDSIGIAKSSWTRTVAESFSGFIVPLAAQGIANSYQQLQKKSTPTPLPIIPSQNPDLVGSWNLQKSGTLPLDEGKLSGELSKVNTARQGR